MSSIDASTPRVFLVRHGETNWSKSGRYTGRADLHLTPEGLRQVTDAGELLVGPGKLIEPSRIAHVWVSPRKRACSTFDILLSRYGFSTDSNKVTVTEDIAEWHYGDYEGLLESEIRNIRKQKGLDRESEWNIWKDGCEKGESALQVTERLDRLISTIKELHRLSLDGNGTSADVVLVAHGLILRAFAKRWINMPLETPLPMMMSAGAIAILSYKKRNINDPAFYIGLSLPSGK